jgi:hypothetical protein
MSLLYQAWTGNVGEGVKELEEDDSVRACVSHMEPYALPIDRGNHHRKGEDENEAILMQGEVPLCGVTNKE